MNLHPGLIIYLVIAALLYAVAAFIYRRKGMRTKRWDTLIGAALLSLTILGYFGVLLDAQWWVAGTIAIIGGGTSITHAMQRRSPAAQGNEH
ncbi:MAG: hypothetical protein IVW55_10245 [Chloroflexi bacterium]|nr:hypothetical protein [Chloroflexota bacterium]